jgi:ring-1,2-phenylacetyl-CoA epoxidase subunit PaaC
MGFDTAYEALTEDNDPRWAFGTGFADPLDGVDTSLPPGVDGDDLAAYCTMLGDDALVMSQRLQEWCTRAPTLEVEVALANVALDLLGQARLLLTRAGHAEGSGRSEDDLAYRRPAEEFRNVVLVEVADGDFAQCVVRLLLFSTWRLALMQRLAATADPVVAAIVAKAVKEVTYHRDYAAQWVVRLGDGTAESHRRTVAAVDRLWPLTAELFATSDVEQRLHRAGVAADPAELRPEFEDVVATVCRAATLPPPGAIGRGEAAGRAGVHMPALTSLLAELQAVAREHPEATW